MQTDVPVAAQKVNGIENEGDTGMLAVKRKKKSEGKDSEKKKKKSEENEGAKRLKSCKEKSRAESDRI